MNMTIVIPSLPETAITLLRYYVEELAEEKPEELATRMLETYGVSEDV